MEIHIQSNQISPQMTAFMLPIGGFPSNYQTCYDQLNIYSLNWKLLGERQNKRHWIGKSQIAKVYPNMHNTKWR